MTLGTAHAVRSRTCMRPGRRQEPSVRVDPAAAGPRRAFFQHCQYLRFTVTVTREAIAACRVRRAGSSGRTHTPGRWVGAVRHGKPSPLQPFAVHFSFSFYTYPKGYVYKNENEEMPRRGPLFCFSISTVHPQPPRNLTRSRREKPRAASVIRTRPSVKLKPHATPGQKPQAKLNT